MESANHDVLVLDSDDDESSTEQGSDDFPAVASARLSAHPTASLPSFFHASMRRGPHTLLSTAGERQASRPRRPLCDMVQQPGAAATQTQTATKRRRRNLNPGAPNLCSSTDAAHITTHGTFNDLSQNTTHDLTVAEHEEEAESDGGFVVDLTQQVQASGLPDRFRVPPQALHLDLTATHSFAVPGLPAPVGVASTEWAVEVEEAAVPLDLEALSSPEKDRGSASPTNTAVTVKCSICLDNVTNMTSTICGHVFCRGCIRSAVQASHKCPSCRLGFI